MESYEKGILGEGTGLDYSPFVVHGLMSRRRRAAFIEAGRRRVEGEGRLPVWKVFIAFRFRFPGVVKIANYCSMNTVACFVCI